MQQTVVFNQLKYETLFHDKFAILLGAICQIHRALALVSVFDTNFNSSIFCTERESREDESQTNKPQNSQKCETHQWHWQSIILLKPITSYVILSFVFMAGEVTGSVYLGWLGRRIDNWILGNDQGGGQPMANIGIKPILKKSTKKILKILRKKKKRPGEGGQWPN